VVLVRETLGDEKEGALEPLFDGGIWRTFLISMQGSQLLCSQRRWVK